MKVCAIIVTYNPNIEEFIVFFESNRYEVDYSIIIDNSEDKLKQKQLFDFQQIENTEIIQLKENKGIAYAQNIGIKRVKELKKFEFVLFLDQDSKLIKNTVNIYREYYIKLTKNNKIAALGIGSTKEKIIHDKYREVSQIISSGTFSPIKVFDEVGYFNEELFIDFVEYEWCWRSLQKGYKIFSISSVNLIHSHGDGKIVFLFWEFVNPSPIRHYYQYRNLLFLLFKNFVPFRWKIKMLLKQIIKTPLYLISLNERKKRCKYIIKGIYDFFRYKKGKY